MKTIKEKIIVKRDVEDDKTEGGIIIPESGKRDMNSGTVLSVGGDVECVKVNDRIVFNMYASTLVTVEGEDVLVIDVDDILVIL